MAELSRILDQLDRAFEGEAWHGPSVKQVLAGVSPPQAAARPLRDGHSIWEIVLHMAVWKDEVRRRIEGDPARTLPPGEDWPSVGTTDEGSWRAALEALSTTHVRLRAAMTRLSDGRLDDPLAGDAGTVWTYYTTLHGIIQHDLYHAGQIAILKKAGDSSVRRESA